MADNEWNSVEDKVHNRDVAFKVSWAGKALLLNPAASPECKSESNLLLCLDYAQMQQPSLSRRYLTHPCI